MKLSEKIKYRIKCITSSLLIFVVLSFILMIVFLPALVLGNVINNRVENTEYQSKDFNLESKELTLLTKDLLELAAWHVETDKPKATIIILSGIRNPSVTGYFGFAKMFADQGYNSLLIEMQGRGSSEGSKLGLGYLEINDVIAGVDYLSNHDKYNNLPIVAMGTSMGASTTIMAAGLDERIDEVISMSAFSSFEDAFYDNMLNLNVPKSLAVIEKPLVKLYLAYKFGLDNTKLSPLKALDDFKQRPLLLMHSKADSDVSFNSFKRLEDKAKSLNLNLSTFVRDGDEHFIVYDKYFDNPEADKAFSLKILSFLKSNFLFDLLVLKLFVLFLDLLS